MSTPPTSINFFVGWSDDKQTYQILGLYEAATTKDVKKAITDASKNHGKPGRYMAIPVDEVTFVDVVFDMVPQLTKVAETDVVPLPETPVVIP
jgi:hypothetical protein